MLLNPFIERTQTRVLRQPKSPLTLFNLFVIDFLGPLFWVCLNVLSYTLALYLAFFR